MGNNNTNPILITIQSGINTPDRIITFEEWSFYRKAFEWRVNNGYTISYPDLQLSHINNIIRYLKLNKAGNEKSMLTIALLTCEIIYRQKCTELEQLSKDFFSTSVY